MKKLLIALAAFSLLLSSCGENKISNANTKSPQTEATKSPNNSAPTKKENTAVTTPKIVAASFEFSGIKPKMKQADVEALGFTVNMTPKPIDKEGMTMQLEVMEIKSASGELLAQAHNQLGGLLEEGISEIDIITHQTLTASGVKLGMPLNNFLHAHPNSDLLWNSISKKAFVTSDDFVGYRFYFSEAAFPEDFNVQAIDYETPETVLAEDQIDRTYPITAIKLSDW